MLVVLLAAAPHAQDSPDAPPPVRVGVAGLTHTHVHWILGREDVGDIEIVGIAEPNRELAARYAEQHGFSMDLVYDTTEEMLDATQPEAVTVFTTIYDHLAVTEAAARRSIHVMVEKPLAVSLDHARRMKALADSAGIHLLTNYETTWYPSVHQLRQHVERGDIGPLRKMVVHDGHQGPIEIGINEEFLEWLIDPVLNGGGAITDFGCYGANLITWLMDGQRPTSVTAVTQTIQPDLYPDVDDEATIIVTYPEAQGIIQASWNWPFSRKDMAVYGTDGFIDAPTADELRVRLHESAPAESMRAEPLPPEHRDPFAYLASVVRGTTAPEDDLSSLSNNMVVMEILDAAIRSAQTGTTILLD
ncbi:MAG: Gfo/Idh/MocA family oxidoreductase [Bacteroidota bacterium]